MEIDYEMTKRAWRRNKAALTRAKNKGDIDGQLKAIRRALNDFNRYGWPDAWRHFAIAAEDLAWVHGRTGLARQQAEAADLAREFAR